MVRISTPSLKLPLGSLEDKSGMTGVGRLYRTGLGSGSIGCTGLAGSASLTGPTRLRIFLQSLACCRVADCEEFVHLVSFLLSRLLAYQEEP